MVRVLVTGGAGFIGSNGVERLLAQNHPPRRFLSPLGLFDFEAMGVKIVLGNRLGRSNGN